MATSETKTRGLESAQALALQTRLNSTFALYGLRAAVVLKDGGVLIQSDDPRVRLIEHRGASHV